MSRVRAAVAVGIAGLFMETHPDPVKAMSDGPNAVPLKHMRALLETLLGFALGAAFGASKAAGDSQAAEQRGAIERIQGQLVSIAEAVAKGTDGEAVKKYTATVSQMALEFGALKTAMVDRRSF